jgi:hypothetical protein
MESEERSRRAKRRVATIKDFYIHLTSYVNVMTPIKLPRRKFFARAAHTQAKNPKSKEVNNGTKALTRLRYLVFAALCRHRRTRSYAMGRLQFHLSDRQRANRDRRSNEATRRSAFHKNLAVCGKLSHFSAEREATRGISIPVVFVVQLKLNCE